MDNKDWVFSGIGVFILSSILALICWIIMAIFRSNRRSKEKTEKSIERFIDEFRKLYKKTGVKLDILIPAGINSLKNDKEIESAFDTLIDVIPNHPLRHWKTRASWEREFVGVRRDDYRSH